MVFTITNFIIKITDTKEESNKAVWFLFDLFITRKQYCKDKNLNKMCNPLSFFYKERLYNYLMSNKYYYNIHLYEVM